MSRSYLDFEPDCQYKDEEANHIIEFQLKDFRKNQLRVQFGNNGVLTVSGERPLEGSKWIRFRKEFSSPKDCKASEIRAKFSSGILYVTIPKKITSPVSRPREMDPLTPVQQASSSPVQDQDKGKLKEEITSSDQIREAAAEAFTDKQSGAVEAMTTPTETTIPAENATMSPMALPKSSISRLRIRRKTAVEVGASVVVVLLALLLIMLFYVFNSHDPMIMDM